MSKTWGRSHGRCMHCDLPISELDRKTMRHINDKYRHHGAPVPYDLDAEDGPADLECDGCITDKAERAEERALSDYYGGSGPETLAETMEKARRLK